jgi:hypothetical protein
MTSDIAYGNKAAKLQIKNVTLVYFINCLHYQIIIVKCTIIILTSKIHDMTDSNNLQRLL